MIQSRPISAGGHLIGVAAQTDREWHLIAIDPRIEDLHGSRYADAQQAERMAQRVYARETAAAANAWSTR
ncbi:MAG: hypothetical protein JWO26_3359 [Rhodospirillales bacterium]|jgi:hypothetical protein|nr:hypothetical protein [Rhodospirillales bacterium]MDB5383727.1 hypothetical protein [Rhodospirillales bacterium]